MVKEKKTKKSEDEVKEEKPEEAKVEIVETEEKTDDAIKPEEKVKTAYDAVDEEQYLKESVRIFDESWKPKTNLGRKVRQGEINDIDEVLDKGEYIQEPQIIDSLVPGIESDFLMIGQSKGKFGGGKRKIFRQTQKKTKEGNKPKFEIMAIVGNKNGYIGLGYGKSKETVPSREKAIRNAKLNLIKIKRGCGSWQCGCKGPHTIPYAIEARCGSVEIKLRPAPKGTGLKVEKECAKMLALAGIKDIWGMARGKTTTKINLMNACFKALKKLTDVKTQEKFVSELGIVEGRLK
jgi:small subunit ribosomal protein S5